MWRPACPCAWRPGGWATSSTANSGAALPAPTCPRAGCSNKAAPCCRATTHPALHPVSRAHCCQESVTTRYQQRAAFDRVRHENAVVECFCQLLKREGSLTKQFAGYASINSPGLEASKKHLAIVPVRDSHIPCWARCRPSDQDTPPPLIVAVSCSPVRGSITGRQGRRRKPIPSSSIANRPLFN